MKYLVLFCALVRLSLGQITAADCMMTLPNLNGSLTSGANLRVCPIGMDQCCTQANENMLGMSLYRVLQNDSDNFTLGSEIYSMRQSAMELYNAMASLRMSFINDVIGMLLRGSVDCTRGVATSCDILNTVATATLDNITVALSGNATAADSIDLEDVISNFFRNGLSRFYFDLHFSMQTQVMCGTNRIFELLFPQVEQDKMSVLAGNLQQMGKIFQLVQRLIMDSARVEVAVQNFTLSQTCTNIWTMRYACPLCAGNNIPLCLGRCNDVLIGCLSPLNQAIVQLNVFRELVVAGVQSLLTGMPLARVNVNSFRSYYSSILNTSNDIDETALIEDVFSRCINTGKRSVKNDFHQKRQTGRADALPTVMIDSAIESQIMSTNLPSLVNASLTSDREYICAYLNFNASTCTSDFNSLDVDDQVTNPAGMFDTTMLLNQAGQQPYVVTDFVNMDVENEALFMNLLPSRTIPDTSFLNDTTTTVSATPTAIPTPTNRGGGAAAVSFSLFTTLMALVLAYFL